MPAAAPAPANPTPQLQPADTKATFRFDQAVVPDVAHEMECAAKPVDVVDDGDYVLSVGAGEVPAAVTLRRGFLGEAEAGRTLAELMQLPWQVRTGRDRCGQEYKEPRETCWFGRPYTYSHVKWDGTDIEDWPEVLTRLRHRLSAELGVEFNSVMCNRYRDGKDKIGWHADDEPSLGRHPTIASLSFGVTRRFLLRRRDTRVQTLPVLVGDPLTVPLSTGDLLVMRGSLQEDWLHSVPAEYHDKPLVRVNLTFRVIQHEPSQHLDLRSEEEKLVQLSGRPWEGSVAEVCCYKSPLEPALLDLASRVLEALPWAVAADGHCPTAQLSLAGAAGGPLQPLAAALAAATGNAELGAGPYVRLTAARLTSAGQCLPWGGSGDGVGDEDVDLVAVLALGEAAHLRPLDLEKRSSSPAQGHLRSARVALRHGGVAVLRPGCGADWRHQLGRTGPAGEAHAPACFLFLRAAPAAAR